MTQHLLLRSPSPILDYDHIIDYSLSGYCNVKSSQAGDRFLLYSMSQRWFEFSDAQFSSHTNVIFIAWSSGTLGNVTFGSSSHLERST